MSLIYNPYGFGELRVYDPHRRPIGVIWPVRAVNVAWPSGACVFTIPQSSRRWSTVYLQQLNLVEYHDARVPFIWIGVIIKHGQDAYEVQITCNPAEWLYQSRFTDWIWGAYVGRAGELMGLLHDTAARWDYLPIVRGDVDLTMPEYEVEYQLKNIRDGMDELAKASGGRWWVEKVGHGHNDPWVHRFSTIQGYDRTADVLLCAEVVDPPNPSMDASTFASTAFVIGGGISNELDDRIKLYMVNDGARRFYGTYQTVIDLGQDPIDPTLVMQLGNQQLFKLASTQISYGLNIDNRRGMWGQFWVGDKIRAMLSKVGYVGYDGPARVLGIQIDCDANKMGLVLEVT